MSKYGKKFTCWQCSTKYYDLGKSNPKCPKCGSEPSSDPLLGGGGGGGLDEAELGAEIDEEFEAAPVDEEEDVEEVEEETVDDDY